MSIVKYSGGKYSQNGEAGIIDECLKRINIDNGMAVEFGAPTKTYCSNIYHLVERGWTGMYYDPNPQEPDITKAFITRENINSYIMQNCRVLSIDIDGNDAEVWEAYKGSPDIVIIEINSSLDPNADYFRPENGSNYSYMKKLGESKGYFLLCHTGNMLFVLNKYKELFPDADETFNTKWL